MTQPVRPTKAKDAIDDKLTNDLGLPSSTVNSTHVLADGRDDLRWMSPVFCQQASLADRRLAGHVILIQTCCVQWQPLACIDQYVSS